MFILLTAIDNTSILLDVERIVAVYEENFSTRIEYAQPKGEGAELVRWKVRESPEEIAEKIEEKRGAEL